MNFKEWFEIQEMDRRCFLKGMVGAGIGLLPGCAPSVKSPPKTKDSVSPAISPPKETSNDGWRNGAFHMIDCQLALDKNSSCPNDFTDE